MRRIAPTLATGLVLLAVAGCGGSTVTQKDVIARGNAICASALRSVRAVPAPAAGTNSASALSGYLNRVLPIVAQEASQLRKLPRPSADKPVLNRYIAAVTSAQGTYETLAAAARRRDIAAVATGLAALRASPAGTYARQYGLTQCATAAGTSAP